MNKFVMLISANRILESLHFKFPGWDVTGYPYLALIRPSASQLAILLTFLGK